MDLSRRRFIGAAGGGALGAALGSQVLGAGTAGKTPGILLFVAEDMGPHIGCYGDLTVPTPNLDRLAREGALFRSAYVTQASCSPSRSSILTGLYPHQNNQLGLAHCGYRMHLGIPNLPGILKQSGYVTGIQGKLHVAPGEAFPFDFRGNGHSKDVQAYGRSGFRMAIDMAPFQRRWDEVVRENYR